MPHEDVVRDVPSSLRRQVFKEYGIVNPRREDYELDYLIALGLGGRGKHSQSVVEPSTSQSSLRDWSCRERTPTTACWAIFSWLDLPTAQKAIASDWITAYKKCFGADKYGTSSKHYLSRNDGDGHAAKKLALPLKAPA